MDGQKLKQFIKLTESKLLNRYLSSRGISYENLTPIQKISYSKSSSFLNWVKLNGARQDVFKEEQIDEISTKTLAKAASAASDPDSDYHYGKSHDPQKFADHAKKTKDAKSAAAVQGAADAKGHYPRPGHSSGSYDNLAHRTNSRITATGKANKQDVKTLKGRIQGRNEEVEDVNEVMDEPNYKNSIQARQAAADKDFKDRQARLAAAGKETAKDPVRLKRLSSIPGYTAAMDLAKKTTKEEAEHVDEKYTSKELKMAGGIAKDKRYAGGNMTGASKVMDKIRAGLSQTKQAQKALRQANEESEQIDELNKDTLYSYAKKSEKDQGDQFDKIGKGIRDNDPKSANAASHKFTRRSIGQNNAEKRLNSESLEIPELQLSELTSNLLARYKTGAAASAKAADAAGNYKKGDKRFKGILNATKKQFGNDLKKHNQTVTKEEIEDWEKEDKSLATYGKKPKFKTVDPKDSLGDNKPHAAAVLSGGKTLTGSPRDTIEIDPIMRLRQGQVDPSKKINKK